MARQSFEDGASVGVHLFRYGLASVVVEADADIERRGAGALEHRERSVDVVAGLPIKHGPQPRLLEYYCAPSSTHMREEQRKRQSRPLVMAQGGTFVRREKD